MIVGAKDGVAKRTTIVSVKILDSDNIPTIDEVNEAWRWAVNDIVKQERVGKATINFCLSKSAGAPLLLTSHDV